MLKKLSERTGLTQTEIKVIGFLLITLFIGFTYKTFFKQNGNEQTREFNYAKEDSTFLNSGSNSDTSETIANSNELKNKDDVLELKNSSKNFSAKILPAERSINLNKADTNSLTNLPGIGKKTADKIIELRNQLGKFKNFDQLLHVKGIGNAKLAKIKKYAYIE
ncbi:MAG: helix-hairpin-helix domain-containing protein [Bacteroidetes bacterium]|nr:helix-hairpin-helix domain-containing protein [Bacteroidota bacterium]